MSDALSPPRRWAWLLRLTPRRDRPHLLRELDALYRLRVERWGRRHADGWYRREMLSLAIRAPWEALRRPVRRGLDHVRRNVVSNLLQDGWRASRSFRSSPGFAVLAVATLALGIGASTLIFSVLDQVVVRPLPYEDPERLVAIWPTQGLLRGELWVLQRESRAFEAVAGWAPIDGFNLEDADGSRRVTGALVSPELLPMLGVRPLLGAGFTPNASRPGNDGVAMVSFALWRDHYGQRDDVIGANIRLDGRSRTIVGVLPRGFALPVPDQDVHVPLVLDPADAGVFWGWGGQRAIGRLADGTTIERARDETLQMARGRMRELNSLWTPNEDFRDEATLVPLREALVGDVETTLWILFGAVGLVLLVACANVANLLLARGLGRQREVALRAALGATRPRLVGEQLAESLVLAGLGGAAAMLLAWVGLDALVALLPPDVPRAAEISLDGRVAGVGLLLALGAGAVAGAVPALRSSRPDPGDVLREGGRGSSGPTRARRHLSSFMVVAQVATAVVLVTGAGLLLRSLAQLSDVETGFRSANVTTARLTLASEGFAAAGSITAFYDEVLDRVGALPGVEAAAVASHVPFGPGAGMMATNIEGVTLDPNSLPVIDRTLVSPDYFHALGIPLLAGRAIRATDTADAALVAVVDDTMAARFWPGESPLGRRIRYPWQGAPWLEIVGVVGGVAADDLSTARQPAYYVPIAQAPNAEVNLVVRSAMPASSVAELVRTIVREIDQGVPVSGVYSMDDLVWGSMANPRWTASVLSLFALVALTLGCVGVYGVIAYSVRQRTAEIGVRMALGAAPQRIRAAVLRDGLALAVPGAVIGVLLAIPSARLLAELLFEVSPLDPLTFAAVPLLLTVASVVAAYLPARRATRVDPVQAIRTDA